MKELVNKHYADKGGHKERSIFWKTMRKLEMTYSPKKRLAWLINNSKGAEKK